MTSPSRKTTLAIIGCKGIPYVYSGYETFVQELAVRLQDKYEIHVYCHRSLFNSRPPKWKNIVLHYIPAIETKYLTHPTAGLFSTIHALIKNYDLYFYVNSCNGPFGWLLKLFKKVSLINTDGLEWKRPQMRGIASVYYYWASKQAARSFQFLIADSKGMAEVYEKEFGRSSEVIAYGANINTQHDSAVILPLGLKKDSYYLVVGRLIPDNNADTIIEGFLRSKSEKKLVIVGDFLFKDPYLTSIRKYASEQVVFLGFVKDSSILHNLFVNSFAYVHGHEFGGTNPTLLQALASGCCVMALDTVFNREVVLDEEFGLLFKKDIDSLASLVVRLEAHRDLVEHYRTKSISRIQTNFTWEKITDQYDKVFQMALAKPISKP